MDTQFYTVQSHIPAKITEFNKSKLIDLFDPVMSCVFAMYAIDW